MVQRDFAPRTFREISHRTWNEAVQLQLHSFIHPREYTPLFSLRMILWDMFTPGSKTKRLLWFFLFFQMKLTVFSRISISVLFGKYARTGWGQCRAGRERGGKMFKLLFKMQEVLCLHFSIQYSFLNNIENLPRLLYFVVLYIHVHNSCIKLLVRLRIHTLILKMICENSMWRL